MTMSNKENSFWQKRHTVVLLCVLAQIIAYVDRVNISVASIAMQESLGWSESTKGIVMSAFFVGYVLTQILGGYLANRFGGKVIMVIAVVSWSFFTILTPYAATISISALITLRVLMGAGEASLSPAVINLFSRWVPEKSKASSLSLYSAAATMGTLVGLLATGYLTQKYGWQASFYIFGVLGWVLVFIIHRIIKNNPSDHASISQQELNELPKTKQYYKDSRPAIPWKALATSQASLALFVTFFCTSWGLYVFMSWLPSYFKAAHGLDLSSAGMYSAAPWLAMAIAMTLGGKLADYLTNKGISKSWVRKSMCLVGMGGSALCMLIIRQAETAESAMILMSLALAFLSINYCAIVPNILDIAPEHGDILYGFMNTVGSLPGVIGVAIVGWLVETTASYDSAFILTASIQITGAVVFVLFGKTTKVTD